MTLLERWDSQKWISWVEVDNQEIRRALVIAQVVDTDVPPQYAKWIIECADELLKGGK